MENSSTKRLTTLAMLTAMAFMVGAVLQIRGAFPAAAHLTYDPKDVVILIGGFMFGPIAALLMSFIVALLEMSTVSVTGIVGAFMNFASSAALTCTAAFIYSKRRNMGGAVLGLAVGCIFATAVMIVLNYFITPLFFDFVTHEAVIELIVPVLLPFNLIKTSLNSVLAIVLYKRVTVALYAAGLYKETTLQKESGFSKQKALIVISLVIAVSLAVLLIYMADIF